MRKTTPLIVQAIFLLFLVVESDGSTAQGAGVLIFTEVDDVQYVLLADHKHLIKSEPERGWAMLAGVSDNSESSVDTAIRETVEESNGAFEELSLRNAIDQTINIHENDFTTYFVKASFVPAAVYSYSVANVDQGVNAERGPFAWIPWVIVSDAAKEAEQLGDTCWDQPIAIAPEYLPESKQTSWFFCAFLEVAILIEKNGGLPELNQTMQR